MPSSYVPDTGPNPGIAGKVGDILRMVRDWLDERGRPAWIVAMILGFIAFWPLGLAILGYMIWSKRMTGCRHHAHHRPSQSFHATGNAAFDAYRDETLRRLEEEQAAFRDFVTRLRAAKDQAEFDQFMAERAQSPVRGTEI